MRANRTIVAVSLTLGLALGPAALSDTASAQGTIPLPEVSVSSSRLGGETLSPTIARNAVSHLSQSILKIEPNVYATDHRILENDCPAWVDRSVQQDLARNKPLRVSPEVWSRKWQIATPFLVGSIRKHCVNVAQAVWPQNETWGVDDIG